MELPDFMSYANKFSNSEFVEKIARIAKRAGAKLVYVALILYYTLQSDKVSTTDKAIIISHHVQVKIKCLCGKWHIQECI